MLSAHRLNSSARAALFKKIYLLAKEKNKPALTAIAADGIGISYRNSTVVELLAKEGHVDAVEFLINEFHQSLNAAVRGYASGGYEAEMDDLIARGANIDDAILGCARRRDDLAVERLQQKGANDEYALMGFAESGDLANTQMLLMSNVNPGYAFIGYVASEQIEDAMHIAEKYNLDLAFMTQTLATHGYESEVDKLTYNNRSLLLPAIFGYAKGGYEEKVTACLQIALDASEELALQTKAAAGYAADGYAAGFKPLLALVPSTKRAIIVHTSLSGHIDLLLPLTTTQSGKDNGLRFLTYEKHLQGIELMLKHGANPKSALDGYLKNQYIREANHYMQGLPIDEITTLCKRFNCLSEDNILWTLVNIENKKIRKSLATAAQKDNPHLDAKKLLLKADGINELMQKNGLTYKQALAYLAPNVNHWIFKGQDWVRAGLPIELYLGFISTLASCSNKDAIKLVDVANERLRERVVTKIESGWFKTFRSSEIRKKIHTTDEHFDKRALQFGSKRYDK